jgi:tetratricopeptide (TPR) repeat protein
LKKLYFKRAYASFIKQQFKAAYSDASRAVELGIKDENTYTICAYSALELELDQEALSYLDKLIRIKPYFLENYHKRGHLRDELGDLEGAIADHDFIIKKNPIRPNITIVVLVYTKKIKNLKKSFETIPQ